MKTAKPRGVLMPIGGSEDKENRKEVLSRVIEETGKDHPWICVITLATNIADEVLADYRRAFPGPKITKY